MSGTRRRPGRMGPIIEGFSARLLEVGYTPGTVRNILKDVGQLGQWMESEKLEVSQLTRTSVEAFIHARRAGMPPVPTVRSFAPLLEYLDRSGHARGRSCAVDACRGPDSALQGLACFRTGTGRSDCAALRGSRPSFLARTCGWGWRPICGGPHGL